MEIRKKVFGLDNLNVADSYFNIGLVYYHFDKYDAALEYYNKAMRIMEKAPKTDLAALHVSFANVYLEKGEFETALEHYQIALDIWEPILGSEHNHIIRIKDKIAEAQAKIIEKENNDGNE